MKEHNNQTIPILTVDKVIEPVSHDMFPTPVGIATKIRNVAIEEFVKNLSQTLGVLTAVLDRVPESSGDFAIDSFTVGLTVDGTGKISLVGEVSAGLASCITVTLKRKSG